MFFKVQAKEFYDHKTHDFTEKPVKSYFADTAIKGNFLIICKLSKLAKTVQSNSNINIK